MNRAAFRPRAAALGAVALLASLSVATANPAAAEPGNDPCQFGFSLFCRLMPIMPELDHNLDLTQNQPPADPSAPPPESLLIPDPCAAGCI